MSTVLNFPRFHVPVNDDPRQWDNWWRETFASGYYTPTLFNTTNIAASTAYPFQYLRVGGVVSASGRVDADPTAAAATVLGLSLPVESILGAASDCAGTGHAPGVAGQSAAILGDVTNGRALLSWVAVDTTNQAFYVTFQYRVIA